MNDSTNIGDNLFPSLGTNVGYEDWIIIENRHHKNEFIQKFEASNFIALVGRNGQGKSFFLKNSFIPFLKEGFAKNGVDKWSIIDINRSRYPLTNLCAKLADLAKQFAKDEKVNPNLEAEFYEMMLTKPLALVDILNDFFTKDRFNFLIVIDKLDELFNDQLVADELASKELRIFSQQIQKANLQNAFPINVVCSVDESSISKLSKFEEIYSLVTKNTFYFRPYESSDILKYLQKITENFFVDVNDSVVKELLDLYSKGTIVLANLIQSLNASYTYFLNDSKAEATIEQSHYKASGSTSAVFDKSFKHSLKSLTEDEKGLLNKITSLIFYKTPQGVLHAKTATTSDLSYLLNYSVTEIGEVLSSISVNNQPIFLMVNAELVESKLEVLSEDHNTNTPIHSTEIFVASSVIIQNLSYIESTVVSFEKDVQKLEEISKDVLRNEALYRDEKQIKVSAWFSALWFSQKLGKMLVENYEEVVRFIHESSLEEERRLNRSKAEEQSRIAKEKRFRLLVISSAALAVIFVVIAVSAAKYLEGKRKETATIENDLILKTLSLNKIQAKADSALRSVDSLTEEFKSKEIETRKKSLELESAKKNIQVQRDSLFYIEQSLADNIARQAKMLQIQDSLEKEALESITLANSAKEEAAFTSAINRINSMVFAGGQMIRNRNPLDNSPLIEAVQLGLAAYDSLQILKKKSYSSTVNAIRYEQTEKDLYSHLTISYSQLHTSSVNAISKPIKQSRSLSTLGVGSNKVFIGTNDGNLLRVDHKELKQVTENIVIDQQSVPLPNSQLRHSLEIEGGQKNLVVLSDGQIVLFDFFYGTVLDVYNDQNIGSVQATSPIYYTKEKTFITLYKGSILEFKIENDKDIKPVNISYIGQSSDQWLRFVYDSDTELAYVREDVKSIAIYSKSRLDGKFEKVDQKYFDELSSDISFLRIIPSSNKVIIGLQNGKLATLESSDEGKELNRSSLNLNILARHENAITHISLNNKLDLVATSATDGRILVWKVNELFSGSVEIIFEREIVDIQAVHSTVFIENDYLMSASSAFKFDEMNRDGQVVLWPLKLDELAEKVRQILLVNEVETAKTIQIEQMK